MIYGDMPAEERPAIVGGWAWWPDYNDPWNQLAPNFLASAMNGGGANAGGYVNDRFEELMAEAEAFTVEDELDTIMLEIQQILTEDDPPAIFYGETKYYTILLEGHWRIRAESALPRYLHLLRSVSRAGGVGRASSWAGDGARGLTR